MLLFKVQKILNSLLACLFVCLFFFTTHAIHFITIYSLQRDEIIVLLPSVALRVFFSPPFTPPSFLVSSKRLLLYAKYITFLVSK